LYITHILRNRRKGITTILGTLIFISILFTTLLPLQLTMLQTDTIESQILNELETADNEKKLEALTLVAYPTTVNSNNLKVRVRNTGTIDILLSKLWIKDQDYILDETVSVGQAKVLGPFDVDLIADTSYPVKVITERGNLFGSNAGNLIYTSQGVWFTPSLGVNVYIANDKGKYFIQINNSTWTSDAYVTQGEDFGDLVVLFDVDTIDTYHVVCRKNSEAGPDLPGTPVDVTITWPDGSPIVFVYTSGLDT